MRGGIAAETPAPVAKQFSNTAAARLAHKLTAQLGHHAGAYYDADSNKLVVNVLDAAAKQRVEKTGATARIVRHTPAQLKAVKHTLTTQSMPGTSRAVDPRTDKVLVTADATVKGATLATLKKQVAAQHGKAVLKQVAGKFTTRIAGSTALGMTSGGSGDCTSGGQTFFQPVTEALQAEGAQLG